MYNYKSACFLLSPTVKVLFNQRNSFLLNFKKDGRTNFREKSENVLSGLAIPHPIPTK